MMITSIFSVCLNVFCAIICIGFKTMFILYEHASGYALFKVKEFEEMGMLLPEVEKGVKDLGKFHSVVTLTSFCPFKSGTNALDNINSISEGVIHEDLRVFLETNLPASKKKNKVTVGVSDSKIGSAISEEMGYSCNHIGVVPEIIRGIRLHFHHLVKGLTEVSASKAQLGLGHSYSRAKVKFNVNRVDNMIIQSIALLDQLDKNINTFTMRIREWYSYHFPELAKICKENHMYCRVAKIMKNRRELTGEKVSALEETVMDEAMVKTIIDAAKSSMAPLKLEKSKFFCLVVCKLFLTSHGYDMQACYRKLCKIQNCREFTGEKVSALEETVMDVAMVKTIIDAAKSSMGMDISPIDLINIETFASKVISLLDYRKGLQEYLGNKMLQVAPNLSALIGDQIGARLIAHAGSLTNLAKYPASTVQILGAEKALFRALKTRGKTPKYGLIFHSTFIGRAKLKNKGRISRYLANKCSIASRIDCFSDIPTSVYGEFMRKQVEDRLKFYETGDIPLKNVDVMKEASGEAVKARAEQVKKDKKQKKKEKKRKRESEMNGTTENGDTTADMTADTTADLTAEADDLEEPPKKKKKKKKNKNKDEDEANNTMETSQEDMNVSMDTSQNVTLDTTQEDGVEGSAKKQKKKKKKAKKNDED